VTCGMGFQESVCTAAILTTECPLWVKADIDECLGHVRFTPKSGHWNSVA